MPAFTSPASLRRLSRAASTRTSTRAIVPPGPTVDTTSPTADTQPAPEAPTSPRPLSPLLHVENDGTIRKAVRAYERDRQRSKKTKERTERERERERHRAAAAAAATPTPDGRPCRHCPSTSPSARRTGLALTLTSASTKEDTSLAHGTPGSPLVEEIIADVVERETRARGSLEVHLAQLVKPAKARRSKGKQRPLFSFLHVCARTDGAFGRSGRVRAGARDPARDRAGRRARGGRGARRAVGAHLRGRARGEARGAAVVRDRRREHGVSGDTPTDTPGRLHCTTAGRRLTDRDNLNMRRPEMYEYV